ncbi:hypothetical protein ACFQ4M_00635 [Thauera mechernichensis]|uniref:Uncharacterized protein n=1 Tax=Thauera mechernichensis TaxID=82788 RepID=A0ABW3W7S6_9RHOO|nr:MULTISPECIES: hypothetical protein [Thauera]ENO78496.1 hypothetical protein B447_14299 [Thauera sp. 27]ENO92345.1 hypothetical protein C662_12572 [Thauera sp. 28]MDG3063562.1 hypothetical protein [Thauera mechernichensis]WBL63535.1 hypothetical protein LQF09_15910 [Thauera sp. WB-2]HAG75463.1 hypothetical protein [Thauera sp.]
MSLQVSTEQLRLISGLISHVARYLDSGCPRAAHEAGMLLRELDARPIDQELNRSCEQLEQAIANSQPPRALRSSAVARDAVSISKLPQSHFSHA